MENNPIAIIKNPWKNRVEKAICEEYSIKNVEFETEFRFPDYCENLTIEFIGVDDDGEIYDGEIQITKVVDY